MKTRPWWLLVLLLLCYAPLAQAQEKEYMYEIGGGLGTSWSYGDVNPSSALYNPSLSFDILYRYNLNLRWALAVEYQNSGLKGDTRDFDYAFPDGPYDYSRRYQQLMVRPEIHFWNYGWGSDYREKKPYSPFLTAGVSAGVVTGDGQDADFVLGVPLGVGYKLKLAKRWNAQITALFTKTFSDQLDGKTDPEGIKTDALIGNDWTAALHLSITFDFKERCVECHNQKNQARH